MSRDRSLVHPLARALTLLLGLVLGPVGTRGAEPVLPAAPGPTPDSTNAPAPRVVINEVMYHPPDDRDELQWVELHNPSLEPVDLAGWKLARGLAFTFTNATRLAPGAFLVVARDRGAFRIRYGTNIPVVGDFRGRLKHGGERIQLLDRQGTPVDSVQFDDQEPWPVSPDGSSASLERILPAGPGDAAVNWAPSPLPRFSAASGTPGQPNAAFRTNLPPIVSSPRFAPPVPDRPFPVTVQVSDPDGIREVQLAYQVWAIPTAPRPDAIPAPPEQRLPMQRTGGDARNGTWTAALPPQPAGRLLRFRVVATDNTGAERIQPHPHDARPTWSAWVGSGTHEALIPAVSLLQFGPPESPGSSLRTGGSMPGRGGRRTASTEPARGACALIYQAPGTAAPQVFDHIRITPRQGGWKVRLQKDRLLDGMSVVNVLFEYQPRFVLAEYLSFELYRAAGVPAPLAGHWRVSLNGRPLGYHLFVEQPNATFLRRVGRDPDGDLYKLLWYGGDVVGQHEKKNNPESGHADLVNTIDTLAGRRGAAQWQFIQERFAVDEFAGYYAVNMCLQNWDGFFNNYFVYRAPGPAGKWEIIPWDEDKTWGDFDGASPQYDWYTMPLTLGMAGDQPKAGLASRFFGGGGGGPFGGVMWWRPPGFFSGPLLANPTFRARFLTRLRELCEQEFTPGKLEPLIAGLETRLEPEVRYRAQVVGRGRNSELEVRFSAGTPGSEIPAGNADAALAQFRRHLDSFRRQVQHRREFILQELARQR